MQKKITDNISYSKKAVSQLLANKPTAAQLEARKAVLVSQINIYTCVVPWPALAASLQTDLRRLNRHRKKLA